MIEDGHHPAEGMRGSWAGAVGQVQFMPSTYLDFAVDYDGDGRRDIWTSVPDALPRANLNARLVLPRRSADPAFLVYRNYRVFMTWNRSTSFAISVGALADEIDGRASLHACQG